MSQEKLRLLLADGLGHGPEANKAVNAAVEAFRACPYSTAVETIQYLHPAIRKTRGAVATVVNFDFKTRKWAIAGIGNISAKFQGPGTSRNYIAYNGIIGHNIPTSMKSQEYDFEEFQTLILCSDGIKSKWDPSKYPLIHRYDLSVLAAALYKDFARKTDDMSVVVSKIAR